MHAVAGSSKGTATSSVQGIGRGTAKLAKETDRSFQFAQAANRIYLVDALIPGEDDRPHAG